MFQWTVLQRGRRKVLRAVVAVKHQVYCFGGLSDSANKYQLNIRVFNTVSLCWTKLPPVSTVGERRPSEVPSLRWGYTAVLVEDVIYIWGGYPCSNRLYGFDVNTHAWLKRNVSGTVPEGRYNHSACALGKVMYVFGGYIGVFKYTDDICKLDTSTVVWSLISTRGTPKAVSGAYPAIIIGTKMFVIGDYYRYIGVFDTETNCWLSTPCTPKDRICHSAFAYNGELYTFGGSRRNGTRTFNDLWKLDCIKNVKPNGKGPHARWYDGVHCCVVGDCVGLIYNVRNNHELYILDLSPSLKTLCKLAVIQYGLKQSQLPHNIRWELAAMKTNNNNNMRQHQITNSRPRNKRKREN